jgi:hypothetical protein
MFKIEKLLKTTGFAIALLLFVTSALLHVFFHDKWHCLSGAIIMAEIGAVILSIIILHYAHEQYLRESEIQKNFEITKRILRDELNQPDLIENVINLVVKYNRLLNKLRGIGINDVLRRLPHDELTKKLETANEIKVFKTFFPEHDDLEIGLINALKRGRSVELYLLKPNSLMLKQRSLSLNEHQDYGKNKVLRALRIMETNMKNGKLVLYDYFPANPILLIDNQMFLGFYFFGEPSPNNPWLQIEYGSAFFARLIQQFEVVENAPSSIVFNNKEAISNFLKKPTEPL